MVQFPGFRCQTLSIHVRLTDSSSAGLPHSAISGSRDICSSPELFAACHGLLRQRAPRHPPWTLSRLTILSFHPFSSSSPLRSARLFLLLFFQRFFFFFFHSVLYLARLVHPFLKKSSLLSSLRASPGSSPFPNIFKDQIT